MTGKVTMSKRINDTILVLLVVFANGCANAMVKVNGKVEDFECFPTGNLGKARKAFLAYVKVEQEAWEDYQYGSGCEPDIDEAWEKHLDRVSFWDHEQDRERERRGGTIW